MRAVWRSLSDKEATEMPKCKELNIKIRVRPEALLGAKPPQKPQPEKKEVKPNG